MATPHDRLRDLGIELPSAPPPAANYVPTRSVPIGEGRSLVYVAGQIPRKPDGGMYTGRVPSQVSVEEARAAARACGVAILAQLEAAGGLDRVEQIAQVIGFVNCEAGFGTGFVEHYRNGVWSILRVPVPPSSQLAAVDARAGNDVWVVGNHRPDADHQYNLVLHFGGAVRKFRAKLFLQ